MKKTKTIFLFLLLISFCLIVESNAQIKSWNNIYTVDGGIALLQGSESSTNLTGYMFSFTFDQVAMGGELAGGFSLGYMRTTEESGDSGNVYSSIPFQLQGKWLFGSDAFKGYLQGGLGLHFSQAEYVGKLYKISGSDNGFMLSAGLGSYITLNEKMFINVVYNFNWLDSQTYQNGVVHTIKLGFAFQ